MLNAALGPARAQVQRRVFLSVVPIAVFDVKISKIQTYRRGATLLLRDSLEPRSASGGDDDAPSQQAEPIASWDDGQGGPRHVCITDSKAVVHERVGKFEFTFPAGQFFQNNNSVLEPLTEYVRDAILNSSRAEDEGVSAVQPLTHLVDTYCGERRNCLDITLSISLGLFSTAGSGLFSITLSPYFDVIAGIEISADSIAFAQRNAALNAIPTSKCTFRAGTASSIFASVASGEFPPERTVVVIDPPRKGCDEPFIEQLVDFRPSLLVYVSCNVRHLGGGEAVFT